MWNKAFWLAIGERAIKTFAQVAVVLIGTDSVGFTDLDWARIASIAGVSAVASILSSVATAGITDGTPSLTTETIPPAEPNMDPHDDTIPA